MGGWRVLGVVVLLTACQLESRDVSAPQRAQSPQPQADLSSPERALASYWARRAWYVDRVRDASRQAQRGLPDLETVYRPVATGDAFRYQTGFAPPPDAVLQRQIEEVREETGSRAVVLARIRNVTPVPESAKPSADELRRRDAGAMFRYVLEKEAAGWRVAQVWQYQSVDDLWEKNADPEVFATPHYPSEVFGDIGDPLRGAAPPSAAPPLDLSTPARGLESYWARRAWYYDLAYWAAKRAWRSLPAVNAVYEPVSTGETLRYWTGFPDLEPEQLERVVQSIEQQGASRAVAVVRLRNVTPVPPGARASPDDVRRRDAGVLFRYVLEREGADWKVADVWKNDGSAGWRKHTDPPPQAPFYPWVNVSD